MTRIVNLYLLLTGATAAVAIMMPWLVIVGLYMLILPGLIMSLAPTAFLWGVGFAIPWYALRGVLGDYLAIGPAAALAAAFFWLAPQASIAQTRVRLVQAVNPDVIPAEPLSLSGNILVSSAFLSTEKDVSNAPYPAGELERRAYVCDALCAALLATPGVRSVTVNAHGKAESGGAPLTLHARTFRLIPKAECSGPSVRPVSPDELIPSSRTSASREGTRQAFSRPMQAEWDVRLSTRDCIVAEAPRTNYDFVIRKHSYRAFEPKSSRNASWVLGPLPVGVERLDVTDGAGRILLSKTLAETAALKVPLRIAADGGMDNFHFHWARKPLRNRERNERFNPHQLLADHTSLRTEVDFAAVMQASRDRLAEALDDPALPGSDPAFRLSAPWLHSLEGQKVDAADRVLIAKAIRDPRVTRFDGIWGVIKAMGDDGVALRQPMVERIAAIDLAASEPPRDLGRTLGSLPAGTFANLTDAERTILADPARRVLAPGLISRQADRGAAAVPMLIGILDYHLRDLVRERAQRRSRQSDNMVPIDRVRMALCMLGPEGASALPAIERLHAEGFVDQRFADSRDWQLMLARIGKPVRDIPKPEKLTGTVEQFQRNLQSRLDRFGPDDCRPQWS